MRYFRFVITIVIAMYGSFANGQTQQGYVKTKGRLGSNGTIVAGTRLSGVTVTIKGLLPLVTNSKGEFSFSLSDSCFYLQSVEKQGYVLTDPDILSKRYVYSKTPLILVLETKEQQADDKLAAAKKIRRTLQRQLQDKEDEIELLKEQQKLSDEEYRKQLQELYDQQEGNEKLLIEIADRYSMIDFDEVDDFNRQISSLILEGRLMEVDSLINIHGDIHTRKAKYRQNKAANDQEEQTIQKRQKKLDKSKAMTQKELEDLAQDCYKRYESFIMVGNLDSAAFYIELRASLDSTNIQWNLDVGNFYQDYVVDNDKSLVYYIKALQAMSQQYGEEHIEVARLLKKIGTIFYKKSDMFNALKYLEKSVKIMHLFLPNSHPDIISIIDITNIINSKMNNKQNQ